MAEFLGSGWQALKGEAHSAPMIDVTESLAQARGLIQARQQKWPPKQSVQDESPLNVARRAFADRRESTLPHGEWLRAGTFLYTPSFEEARLDRTASVIERVAPGDFEDGLLVEQIARQAASVEMYLISRQFDATVAMAAERIIFGTTAAPISHASCYRVKDIALIEFSQGLLNLLSVAALAVVRAHVPTDPIPGYKGWSSDLGDVEQYLDTNPGAVDLLVDFFVNWMTDGRPSTSQPLEIHTTLTMPYEILTSFAQRFVIAHEYAHALVDKLGIEVLRSDDSTYDEPTQKEIRADLFGVVAIGRASGKLDGVAPNVALQGSVLAMKAHELLLRARQLADQPEDLVGREASGHPSFSQRAVLCREVYRWCLPNVNDTKADVGGMTVPARTAEILWRRAVPHIITAIQERGLHPLWRGGI